MLDLSDATHPLELALVNPVTQSALRLVRKHGAGVHKAVFRVPATRKMTYTAIDHTLEAWLPNVHYVAGFRVKALKGKLPVGRLRAHVDTVPVVDEDLSLFTQGILPSKVPWKKTNALFSVVEIEGRLSRPQEICGYALPNGSQLKVFLEIDSSPRSAFLEIEVLGGYYESNSTPLPSKF